MSNVHRSTNWNIEKHVLCNDPTVDWLSHEHILYAVITVVLFVFVTLLPSLLLCVYPGTRDYSGIFHFCMQH